MDNKDQKIKEVLERGVENIYPEKMELEKALRSGKKLKIYNGIDPTGDLHIGHGVVLNKLRQLQDLGHEIIVLIGDFTAQIGDPTDKAETRKAQTKKEVLDNAKHYQKLIGKILDPKKTKFEYNSRWLSKMNFTDVIELASHFTVQRLLERDMFQARIKAGKPIHVHEFLYPALVGYDCVALDVDMEIGGNDQTYNMLAGRTLMKALKNKDKFVLTVKLLVDPTGKKMGKTEGNMVSLSDSPEDMYGKVMSWTDAMIVPAFEIATQVPMNEIAAIKKELSNGQNPKVAKMKLAKSIVTLYHSKAGAEKAEENFKQIFEDKAQPTDIAEIKTSKRNIVDVLLDVGLVSSKSEARRVLAQGGIKIDGKKVTEETATVAKGATIQKGKRHFVKIV